GEKRAGAIVANWKSEALRREFLIFLQGNGLGPGMSLRALEALGPEALHEVQRNPFVLLEQVAGIGFRTADRVALATGIPPDAPSRLSAALRHVLDESLLEGHFCLPGEELLQRSQELTGVDADALRAELRESVGGGRLVIARPRDLGHPFSVYELFAWECENEAAGLLRGLIHGRGVTLGLPPEALERAASTLSDEQFMAVRSILDANVAVLTGGPGVGKTTTLRELVELWSSAHLELALCCPTGRAAKRLQDVSGRPATTIHRLLKYDGHRSRFVHGEDFRLTADVVVCDEASMIDLPLFVHLLRALKPGSRLLMVGDIDQLPSVGPGCVLADIVASGLVPVHRLTRIFRQREGSAIVELALGILQGRGGLDDVLYSADVEIIRELDAARGARRARELLLEVLPRRLSLAGPEDIQILAPTHRGPAGTREINRLVQEARASGRNRLESGDRVYLVGDRVMQVRNDYDRELFNGDQGEIVHIDPAAGEVVVTFQGQSQTYRREGLRDIVPAWAMTVHKSQGAEYPAVVLLLYGHHHVLLKRQVVYTAVTRARRALVIVGDPKAIGRAIADADLASRYGHFRHWLQGDAPELWRPQSMGGVANPTGRGPAGPDE
ncbi:MAG: AAA family ATPase, partial [Planctomycetes bacterium]|nr:AAA family ATPase [Planctomycetota bacterium]